MRMTAMVLAACMICSAWVFADDEMMLVRLADGGDMKVYDDRVTLPDFGDDNDFIRDEALLARFGSPDDQPLSLTLCREGKTWTVKLDGEGERAYVLLKLDDELDRGGDCR